MTPPNDALDAADIDQHALDSLIAAVIARQTAIVEEAHELIRSEIPAYGKIRDPEFVRDHHDHIAAHVEALLRWLPAGEELTRDDLAFVRGPATRRSHRIPLDAFLRSFLTFERVVWSAFVAEARDGPRRQAALWIAARLHDYVGVATTHAAEIYVAARQPLAGERIRLDLLADLLTGRDPEPGACQDVARAAGLVPGARCLVIATSPPAPWVDEHEARSVAAAIARACGGPAAPLSIAREDEVVAVTAIAERDPARIEAELRRVWRRLADQGVRLAIGVSAVQSGPQDIPLAYDEACAARARLASEGGVVSLATLSAFEYLTSRGGVTVQRLISPRVREFIEQDRAQGGILASTLLAYFDADLSAKATAERLPAHVNTVHYRLARIEQRTGSNIRSISDVLELVIAIKLRFPSSG